MGTEAIARVGQRFVPICATVVLALGSSAAMAVETTPGDGLLKFANVRVVDAPAPVATAVASQAGYRVYKDAGTGELRAPTAEEMQAVSRETAPEATVIKKSYMANGATRVVLDESFLQYSMAVRQPDGSLAELCVTGADQANEVIENAAARAAGSAREARNVR